MSVECLVMLRRPDMIVSEAGVDIDESPLGLLMISLLDLVVGNDSTVHGASG